ncbi:hypothetical protein [Peribacillus sp. NPDC055009]
MRYKIDFGPVFVQCIITMTFGYFWTLLGERPEAFVYGNIIYEAVSVISFILTNLAIGIAGAIVFYFISQFLEKNKNFEKTLCDEVFQLRVKDKEYTQGELVEHVFFDFLDEVRKNYSVVGSIYTRLNVQKQQLPLVNDQPLLPAKSKTTVITKVFRDDVFRAEVLFKRPVQFCA